MVMRTTKHVFNYNQLIFIILWTGFYYSSAGIIQNTNNDNKYPVILIPGDGGSRAYALSVKNPNEKPSILWLNLKDFFDSDTITDLFSLRYEESSGKLYDNNDEYKVIFPGWGDTENIATLDSKEKIFGRYFDGIIEDLIQDTFFISNKSIRGAPYDFRRAPIQNERFFVQLKQLVEETYALNGNRRVIIIGHSLGCLYTYTFFERQTLDWKKRYIKAFVSLAGPYGGAVKVLKVAAIGENFGAFFRNPLVFRSLQRSFPSLTFMVPDPRLWPENESIIITHNTTYTSRDYKRLFQEMNYPLGFRFMQETRKGIDFFKGPTGVDEVYCIYGSGIETPQQLIYSAPSFIHKAFPNQIPAVLSGDGDGTVNLRSLRVCQNWKNGFVMELPQANHMFVMRDPRVLKLIRKITGFQKPQDSLELFENLKT